MVPRAFMSWHFDISCYGGDWYEELAMLVHAELSKSLVYMFREGVYGALLLPQICWAMPRSMPILKLVPTIPPFGGNFHVPSRRF